MTYGQSASQSWCQAPSGARGQNYITVRQLLFCRCWAPYLTRGRVCQRVHSQLYMSLIFTNLHLGILRRQSGFKSRVPCEYLLFHVEAI
jgi:hypothetical protein